MKIKETRRKYIFKKLLKASFFPILIFTLYFLINNYYEKSIISHSGNIDLSKLMKQTKSEKKMGRKIQIKVLNGCGEKGIADLYKNFLRNKGYDVIDYGNAINFDFINTTLKIHNEDHEDFIFEIVDLLNIKPDKLDYNYSRNIFYDMTLIIGKDYKNLKSFIEVSMHYEPF